MEGSSALNQFVVLAQTQQGKAVEEMVKQVLGHSNIFVFGELLDCPNVQALASSPEGRGYLELLQIFAHGTYVDYKARCSELPKLTDAQCRKLQLLTVVTFATKDKIINYSDLQRALDLDVRDLETLIIEAIYQNLIVGKMDQEHQCLVVETCSVRDCREQDIDYIIETLTAWHSSAQNLLAGVDNMIQYSHDSAEQHKASREQLEKLVQSTRESLKEGDGMKGTGDGGGGCTRMPTDDADEESKRAKSTRGRWMGAVGPSSRGKH
eukprot:gnl/TRDRNA2_/TRDRNA2_60977_c0_seq1.p1 gnl/TRDRNA2_/TRDRNA2_60977_c0~~gnl/TRDRNA2_/TRDRNA2_60977_c0_seq1.p1  ORF type:complete len:266 (-),score=64.14 gnl/TRDRNA2_/TRDRNA2_60977_c0_seq1:121-918(-)